MVHLSFVVCLMGIICFYSLCTSSILCEDLYSHSSCQFNRLCTCLRPTPDMGTVTCINVPMTVLPVFNMSIINELRLENNGLQLLNERNFVRTGMQYMKLRQNHITSIAKDAFFGLEKTLMHLDLTNNQLYAVPRQALQTLTKLKYLDLSGNFIHQVSGEDFQGLERSLKNLLVRNNDLTEKTLDAFANLNALESLDLSGNRLAFFEASFLNGLTKLMSIDLSDNILSALPYSLLQNLKSLKKLNLARNCITTVGLGEVSRIPRQIPMTPINNGITLEELILDENYIEALPPRAFQYFQRINRLSMNGNSMTKISDNAFGGPKIREIYLISNDLIDLSPTAFTSLDDYLQLLDMSHNHLNERTVGAALENMTALVNVSLIGNEIHTLPESCFSNSNQSLQFLQLESAEQLNTGSRSSITAEDLQDLQHLRSFGQSQFPNTVLTGVEFAGVSSNLEKLALKWSNLVHVTAEAFRHTPNLKSLDLSFNKLESIDEGAFQVMAYHLEYLDLSKALAKTVTQLPDKTFDHLSKLKELDLSNNRLRNVQQQSFHSLTDLVFLNLQDNFIENYQVGTILKSIHNKLERLKLSFNHITQLNPYSFTGLRSLQNLYLDDNRINVVSKSAFSDLEALRHLDLQGNHMENVVCEAFENLPRLTSLNLAHNSLKYFPLCIFNQVGSMSFLKVNVSYNNVERLTANLTDNLFPHIKILDFSHNNISDIEPTYFQPLEMLLEQLYMSYNALSNVTKSMFGQMTQLATLRLDHNRITRLDFDAFENFISLKVLTLSHNQVATIPRELFVSAPQLQYLDVSHNSIDELPDGLFLGTNKLQYLNLASNRLIRFPSTAVTPLASSLYHLDLSRNRIRHLSSTALPHLLSLDLSFNDLPDITDGATFKKWTPRLHYLDVSNNLVGDTLRALSTAVGGQPLVQINLSNTNLTHIPNLDLPSLKHLNLSKNNIAAIHSGSFINMTDIRELDLSFNKLSTVPANDIWRTISKLRSLNLAHNPIKTISANQSFTGLNNIDHLNIQGLPVGKLQSNVLSSLKTLKTLKINLYDNDATGTTSNLFSTISPMAGLKSLHLSVNDFQGDDKVSNLIFKSNAAHGLPPKLTDVTIAGQSFHQFGSGALKTFRNRRLHLTFDNVSASSLWLDTFRSMGSVRLLWLDLTGNTFATVADPNSAQIPGGKGIFLQTLQMGGNRWTCDCSIGWIEHWSRNFRHVNCQDKGAPAIYQRCQEVMENLRFTRCQDRENKTLMDVLKHDIECESKSSAFAASPKVPFGVFILVLTVHIAIRAND